MKRALDYLSKLSFENMTHTGIMQISKDMDDFNQKEQFEILLGLYAHSLCGMPLKEESLPEAIHGVLDEKLNLESNTSVPSIKEENSVMGYKRRFFGQKS